ncbi:MAG: sulfatase-like hydrolase/transferase, partial [Actinomycetota bacterium]|nr:sulfatase-like hydrolase/transferase [Actinomycetota bacterium]
MSALLVAILALFALLGCAPSVETLRNWVKQDEIDEDDVSNKPDAYRRPSLSGGEKRKLRRAYEGKLEALQGVDDLVGSLVGTLKETRQLENTYVVYLTDNGYLLGEHRHEAKGKPYEGSIRTPLLVRGPGVPAGERREELVANVDLAPTIAGWAGAP